MDIQAQVAARRAQLINEKKEQQAEKEARAAQRLAAQQKRREAELDQVASDLSTDEVEIRREGNGLMIVPEDQLSVINGVGLRMSEANNLLDTETRKAWTPRENWQVIGCISAGIVLLHIPPLGVCLLIVGFWRMFVVNKRHKNKLVEKYPHLFNKS